MQNKCSAPECGRPTSGPNSIPDKATRIGVAAHITAASPGGPRYSPLLSTEERRSISNGIWLCQNHARLIDADPEKYPVLKLLEWKRLAEEAAQNGLIGGAVNASGVVEEIEGIQQEGLICPYCKSFVELDQRVCRGCNADVITGGTNKELTQAWQTGLLIGGVFSFFLFVLLPSWLGSHTTLPARQGFGLGYYAFGFGIGITLISGFICQNFENGRHLKRLPRFVRNTRN